MFSTTTRLLRRAFLAPAMAVAAIAATATPSTTVVVPHFEHCVGTLDTITADSMEFSGRGRATHFGRYWIAGGHDYDQFGNVTNGQFVTTTADGSTIAGTYSGTFTPQADGSIDFEVVVDWLVGTGRLDGVTGHAEVVAVVDSATPGAGLEYFTDGFLTFP